MGAVKRRRARTLVIRGLELVELGKQEAVKGGGFSVILSPPRQTKDLLSPRGRKPGLLH